MSADTRRAKRRRKLPTGEYSVNLAEINKLKPSGMGTIRLLRPYLCAHRTVACEIRLFTLHHSRISNTLGGVIDRTPEVPGYAALSYSWGGHPADCLIEVNDASRTWDAAVSVDLQDALASMARANEMQWLWVDALCINQSSAAEKSDQVERMKTIYGRATCLYAWLGGEVSSMTDEAVSAEHQQTGLMCRKLFDLLDQGPRVWWKRLWVVQEIASCETIKVCIGSRVTEWQAFVDLFCNDNTKQYALKIMHGSQAESNSRIEQAQDDLITLKRFREQIRKSRSGMAIAPLLLSTAPSGVSDPLDRVYSLLGLASNDVRREIDVRYRYASNIAALWGDVVQCHFKTTSNMDIVFDQWPRGKGISVLTTVLRRDSERSLGGPLFMAIHDKLATSMPTWMPDFSKAPRIEQPLMPLRLYYASGLQPAVFHFEGPILSIGAIKCDVVSGLGPAMEMEAVLRQGNRAHRLLVTNMAKQLVDEVRKLDPHPLFPQPRDSSAMYSDIVYWPDRDLMALRPFYTRSGLVGWTFHELREGDEMIVPFGCKILVAVRGQKLSTSITPSSYPEARYYNLLGECYVPGMMHGEAMSLYDDGELRSETYKLV